MKIYYWYWQSNMLLEINKAWYLTQSLQNKTRGDVRDIIYNKLLTHGLACCLSQFQSEHKFIEHTMEIFDQSPIRLIKKLLDDGHTLLNYRIAEMKDIYYET